MSIVADIVFFFLIDAIEAAWRYGRRRLFGAAPSPGRSPGSSLADKPTRMTCESGICPANLVESRSAGPQGLGERWPIGRIPTCHSIYYCYYLL